ncbi:hypothetical protein QEN19_003484 [Hanseniaspora menglaensis]
MNKVNVSLTAVTAIASFFVGSHFGNIKTTTRTTSKNNKQAQLFESDEEDHDSEEDSDMESVDDFMNNKSNEYCSFNDEVRLAICIRKDLKMTKGKTIAQSCHATLACFRSLNNSINGPKLLEKWLSKGQAKITLQIESEEHLQELWFKAKELGVMACPIRDAGRTQVEPGTVTVIGIGPAPKSVLDQITGGLKLY